MEVNLFVTFFNNILFHRVPHLTDPNWTALVIFHTMTEMQRKLIVNVVKKLFLSLIFIGPP